MLWRDIVRVGVKGGVLASWAIGCTLVGACRQSNDVVLYASVDRQLAEPIATAFEKSSGTDVRAIFDVEANKTVGLVNRLSAEGSAPRADVFWSGEFARTIDLCDRGVLESGAIESPTSVNAALDDPNGCWFLLAARLRVLLVHGPVTSTRADPASIEDLASPQWRGRACLANPHFGTTSTHFAALLTRWGEPRFRRWLQDLEANGVAILPGNAQVRDAVSRGVCGLGLTDTDDALEALRERAPVRLLIPDQRRDDIGVFVVPSTVAAVTGGPNPASGRQLIRFLLSAEGERQLASGTGGFLPVRHPTLDGPAGLPALRDLVVLRVDYVDVARSIPLMLRIVDEEWAH